MAGATSLTRNANDDHDGGSDDDGPDFSHADDDDDADHGAGNDDCDGNDGHGGNDVSVCPGKANT